MVSSAIVMHFMSNRLDDDKNNNGKLLVGINIFYILFMFIFAITKNFRLMLMAYLATNTFRTINQPIFSAWLNGHIDDKARATVLSINGQINALGQILGGPIIGIVAHVDAGKTTYDPLNKKEYLLHKLNTIRD